MHKIKSLDLQEICQRDLSSFVVSLSAPKLWRCEISGAINTFETARTWARSVAPQGLCYQLNSHHAV